MSRSNSLFFCCAPPKMPTFTLQTPKCFELTQPNTRRPASDFLFSHFAYFRHKSNMTIKICNVNYAIQRYFYGGNSRQSLSMLHFLGFLVKYLRFCRSLSKVWCKDTFSNDDFPTKPGLRSQRMLTPFRSVYECSILQNADILVL